jgi:hypothetical protein
MSSIVSERARIENEMKRLQERLSILEAAEVTPVVKAMPFPNQIAAAEKVLRTYAVTGFRYGLLKANEQSGKTGTYHYLIRRMFELNRVDNVYILCGSHETELLSQCQKDVEEWHEGASYKSNIHCVFRQYFGRTTMNTSRCLIIIDESHLVEGVDQTLNAFLNKHHLSMAGTTPSMVSNKTYMLSVDATPYAEESAIMYKLGRDKFKVILDDGEGYYGVKEYYENNLINSTFDLVTNGDDFKRLLQIISQKYALIRIQSTNDDKAKMEEYARECGCDIVHFNSKYTKKNAKVYVTKDEADEHYREYGSRVLSLEEAPSNTTIVFIDGRLRCGKRVPKKHIGFVWEAMKISKTDIIRQSLLGRMCGYLGDKLYTVPTEKKPLIFVPNRILEKQEIKKVVTMSDLERSIYSVVDDATVFTPRLANNIIPGRIQNKAVRDDIEVTQCVPVRFELNTEQSSSLATDPSRLDVLKWCFNSLIEDNLDLINNNATLTNEQKDEIRVWLGSRTVEDCKLRRYKDDSNVNMHKCHVEAYLDQCASKEHTQMDFLTFCVVYPGFNQHESIKTTAKVGEVYAIFYTKATGYAFTINKDSRVARVTNNTHFSTQVIPEIAACVAGGVYGFSPKIKTDSAELIKQLSYFIEISKRDIGTISKRLTSLCNGEYIRLPSNVYSYALVKETFASLELMHGVSISFEFKKRRPSPSSFFDIELKFISWE